MLICNAVWECLLIPLQQKWPLLWFCPGNIDRWFIRLVYVTLRYWIAAIFDVSFGKSYLLNMCFYTTLQSLWCMVYWFPFLNFTIKHIILPLTHKSFTFLLISNKNHCSLYSWHKRSLSRRHSLLHCHGDVIAPEQMIGSSIYDISQGKSMEINGMVRWKMVGIANYLAVSKYHLTAGEKTDQK